MTSWKLQRNEKKTRVDLGKVGSHAWFAWDSGAGPGRVLGQVTGLGPPLRSQLQPKAEELSQVLEGQEA